MLSVRVDYNDKEYLIVGTADEQQNGVLEINTDGNAVTHVTCLVLNCAKLFTSSEQNSTVYDLYKEIYSKRNSYIPSEEISVKSKVRFTSVILKINLIDSIYKHKKLYCKIQPRLQLPSK